MMPERLAFAALGFVVYMGSTWAVVNFAGPHIVRAVHHVTGLPIAGSLGRLGGLPEYRAPARARPARED